MEIRRRKMAYIVLNSLFVGVLSGMVCLAQNPAASHSANKSAAPSSSSERASAEASSPQKVVLKVGNANVTKADLDYVIRSLGPQAQKAVATQGRKPIGDEYAMMLLLSQKAQREHLDASPEIQRQLALEKLRLLAQEEYQRMAEATKVSSDEISAYYNAHKGDFEEAQVREIVVRKKPANGKPSDPGLTAEEARARLASIRKAIEAGTSVEQVAKKFDIANVVMVDPESQTVHRGEMIPALDKVAFELKDNQFSDPIDTPRAMVLLQVLGHTQPDLKAVSPKIENALRQQKLQVTMNDLKAKANIWMDPEYFKAPGEASGASATTPKTPAQP